MLNKRGFIAEQDKRFRFPKLMSPLFLRVYAEGEPAPATPPVPPEGDPNPAPSFNFEAMIAQARKEEKDKLYPRLKKAEDDNKTLTASVNGYLLEIAALKDELEKAKSTKDTTEVDGLNSRIKELEKELETLKKSAPNEEELRKTIEKEYEVKLYIQEKVQENKDSILSMLTSDIKGATKEEVDAAITAAKEKTIQVKKDLGLVDDEGNPITPTKKKSPEKVAPKKAPPAAPAMDDNDEFDAEYVRNLDPRSKEYAEFRKKMGLK